MQSMRSLIDEISVKEIVAQCDWPSICRDPVRGDEIEHEEAVEYFKILDMNQHDHKNYTAIRYMSRALTHKGFHYFLPLFILDSIEKPKSEITEALLNILCESSYVKYPIFRDYKDISDEQINAISFYLIFISDKYTKDSEKQEEILYCAGQCWKVKTDTSRKN